jgi:hypothetical protein
VLIEGAGRAKGLMTASLAAVTTPSARPRPAAAGAGEPGSLSGQVVGVRGVAGHLGRLREELCPGKDRCRGQRRGDTADGGRPGAGVTRLQAGDTGLGQAGAPGKLTGGQAPPGALVVESGRVDSDSVWLRVSPRFGAKVRQLRERVVSEDLIHQGRTPSCLLTDANGSGLK